MSLRTVEIVGGGVAGLSLGCALRSRGVPVNLYEAGRYPRHRVCGEFICGLDESTIQTLGLDELLADARPLRTVAWYRDGRVEKAHELPSPALALSRYKLDARLAHRFQELGGRLHEQTRHRVGDGESVEGVVFCCGRKRRPTEWMGLKMHVASMPVEYELEVHLGHGAYVGLCPIEDGRVNVCGLFQRRPELKVRRETALIEYLRACGMEELAGRIESARACLESCSAVAGFSFEKPSMRAGCLELGDAFAMIPPFTGHGMAIAIQCAEEALGPIVRWAEGRVQWDSAVAGIQSRLQERFRMRLDSARWLHPFFFAPLRQRMLSLSNRLGLVPATPLYHLLHS